MTEVSHFLEAFGFSFDYRKLNCGSIFHKESIFNLAASNPFVFQF
jgi:hypothetical protein